MGLTYSIYNSRVITINHKYSSTRDNLSAMESVFIIVIIETIDLLQYSISMLIYYAS